MNAFNWKRHTSLLKLNKKHTISVHRFYTTASKPYLFSILYLYLTVQYLHEGSVYFAFSAIQTISSLIRNTGWTRFRSFNTGGQIVLSWYYGLCNPKDAITSCPWQMCPRTKVLVRCVAWTTRPLDDASLYSVSHRVYTVPQADYPIVRIGSSHRLIRKRVLLGEDTLAHCGGGRGNQFRRWDRLSVTLGIP